MLNTELGTRPQCECHECTQARWKMSAQYQLVGALQQLQPQTQLQGMGTASDALEKAQLQYGGKIPLHQV